MSLANMVKWVVGTILFVGIGMAIITRLPMGIRNIVLNKQV